MSRDRNHGSGHASEKKDYSGGDGGGQQEQERQAEHADAANANAEEGEATSGDPSATSQTTHGGSPGEAEAGGGQRGVVIGSTVDDNAPGSTGPGTPQMEGGPDTGRSF